jgi:hypothetical protein
LRAQGSGFRVYCLRVRIARRDLIFVSGGLRVSGFGFRVSGFGFRFSGFMSGV